MSVVSCDPAAKSCTYQKSQLGPFFPCAFELFAEKSMAILPVRSLPRRQDILHRRRMRCGRHVKSGGGYSVKSVKLVKSTDVYVECDIDTAIIIQSTAMIRCLFITQLCSFVMTQRSLLDGIGRGQAVDVDF